MSEVEIPNPEEAREIRERTFSKRVALVTAVYAVILAITSLGGNNATKDMMIAQEQASDHWAFYQAKAVREHIYHVGEIQLRSSVLQTKQSQDSELQAMLEKEIEKMKKEEERFRQEKAEIEQRARQWEDQRDVSMAKDPYFDYAEVLLQISIVLATISIISISPSVFWFSMVIAIVGSLLSLDGFTLFLRLPFLG